MKMHNLFLSVIAISSLSVYGMEMAECQRRNSTVNSRRSTPAFASDTLNIRQNKRKRDELAQEKEQRLIKRPALSLLNPSVSSLHDRKESSEFKKALANTFFAPIGESSDLPCTRQPGTWLEVPEVQPKVKIQSSRSQWYKSGKLVDRSPFFFHQCIKEREEKAQKTLQAFFNEYGVPLSEAQAQTLQHLPVTTLYNKLLSPLMIALLENFGESLEATIAIQSDKFLRPSHSKSE